MGTKDDDHDGRPDDEDNDFKDDDEEACNPASGGGGGWSWGGDSGGTSGGVKSGGDKSQVEQQTKLHNQQTASSNGVAQKISTPKSTNLNYLRRVAVKKAWLNEYNNVKNGGTGVTRTWSSAQMSELLATGKVKGFNGHHIKNVNDHTDLAGDPNNIQFLTRKEHYDAHRGDWRNETNEFYYCGQFDLP